MTNNIWTPDHVRGQCALLFTDLAFRRKGGLSTSSNSGPDLGVTTNGPIRVKQVTQCPSVIGHIDELASTTC